MKIFCSFCSFCSFFSFCGRARDSLEGPHEEAEIQRKALRRKKCLVFMRRYMFRKKRVRSKVIPRKVGLGLKRKGELNKRKWNWKLAWWESTEKKETTYLIGSRGRHQYSDRRSSRIRAPCVASIAVESEREEDQMDRSSA